MEKETEGIQQDPGSNVPEGGDGDQGSTIDVEGIKKNRDEILKEKKELERKYKTLIADQDSKEQARLEEEKKYKDLYEKVKAEKADLEAKILETTQLRSLEAKAREHGFDVDYIKSIEGAEYDQDGNLTNGDDLFKGLKETKPRFFVDAQEQKVTIETSKPTIFKSGHRFTREEIRSMSIEDYGKNREEIQRQEKAGLVQ